MHGNKGLQTIKGSPVSQPPTLYVVVVRAELVLIIVSPKVLLPPLSSPPASPSWRGRGNRVWHIIQSLWRRSTPHRSRIKAAALPSSTSETTVIATNSISPLYNDSVENIMKASRQNLISSHSLSTSSALKRHPRARWIILFFACWIIVGNYYVFDNPAVLITEMQEYLESPDTVFQYQHQLLYSVYALPNLALPLIAGALVDRFGTHKLLLLLAVLNVLGQFAFCLGTGNRTFGAMIFGRVLIGVGGESLAVAQTKILTDWFRGRELALAVSMSLSIAALGTVANSYISPLIAHTAGLLAALWVGLAFCLLSCFCSFITVFFDKRWQKLAKQIYSLEDMTRENLNTNNLQVASAEIAPPMIESRGFQPAFILLCTSIFLYYSAYGPFNNIASKFLQDRYFHNDSVTAGRVMSIPDLLGVFVGPVLGVLVDRYGYKGGMLVVGGAIMSLAHIIFAFTTTTPYVSLVFIGIAASTFMAFWPCVPILVHERSLSTGYGILTTLTNFSGVVVPILVAYLETQDTTYFAAEIFFASVTAIGAVFALCLNFYAAHLGLNDCEIEKICTAPDLAIAAASAVSLQIDATTISNEEEIQKITKVMTKEEDKQQVILTENNQILTSIPAVEALGEGLADSTDCLLHRHPS